ncbi:unnamed protein product [Urochloa humidicola]
MIHVMSQSFTRKFLAGGLLCLQYEPDDIQCQIFGPQMNSCNFHVLQSSAAELHGFEEDAMGSPKPVPDLCFH